MDSNLQRLEQDLRSESAPFIERELRAEVYRFTHSNKMEHVSELEIRLAAIRDKWDKDIARHAARVRQSISEETKNSEPSQFDPDVLRNIEDFLGREIYGCHCHGMQSKEPSRIAAFTTHPGDGEGRKRRMATRDEIEREVRGECADAMEYDLQAARDQLMEACQADVDAALVQEWKEFVKKRRPEILQNFMDARKDELEALLDPVREMWADRIRVAVDERMAEAEDAGGTGENAQEAI